MFGDKMLKGYITGWSYHLSLIHSSLPDQPGVTANAFCKLSPSLSFLHITHSAFSDSALPAPTQLPGLLGVDPVVFFLGHKGYCSLGSSFRLKLIWRWWTSSQPRETTSQGASHLCCCLGSVWWFFSFYLGTPPVLVVVPVWLQFTLTLP